MTIGGFRFAGIEAGIKQRGGLDLALAVADEPVPSAGVFTRNRVRAAPVDLASRRVASGRAQAILANAGCANACTGAEGAKAAERSTADVARSLSIDTSLVLPASTGVIGAVLPSDRVASAADTLVGDLSTDGHDRFAQAILTTDRFPKTARASIEGGGDVLGIAKGAGMIHPDMGIDPPPPSGPPHATMLAFLFTDAVADVDLLRSALMVATDMTFNRCSVDGDTSTNDCVLLLASGKSGATPSRRALTEALMETCSALARDMVRDGEGAEHAVEILVRGLASSDDAEVVARTIATSLLVKTAIFGRDANWGRILGAAGRAGVEFDPSEARIVVGDVEIVRDGLGLGAEAEKRAAEQMAAEHYAIEVVLGPGPGEFAYLTSDLGHGYVDVNAGYRS